jgi:IPT/TIG domain-containing protein
MAERKKSSLKPRLPEARAAPVPTHRSLMSTTGRVGKTVEVLGQGFTGTTAVSFNGTAATFNVWSDTYLQTTVPTGATTSFVTVTTPSGTLTSNKQFRVKP